LTADIEIESVIDYSTTLPRDGDILLLKEHRHWNSDEYGQVLISNDQAGFLHAHYAYPRGYYNRHLAAANLNRYVFGFDIIPSLSLIAVSNWAYGVRLVKYNATSYHTWWREGLHIVKRKSVQSIEAEIESTDVTDFRDVRVFDDQSGNIYLYCVDVYYGLIVLQVDISTYDMTVVAHSKYDHPDWPTGTTVGSSTTKFPYSRTWECELSNDNNYLYVTAVEGIFLVYDITNKTNPILLSETTLGVINSTSGKRVTSVYAPAVDIGNNDLVYIPSNSGLYILDVSDPSSVVLIGSLPLYGSGVGTDREFTAKTIIPKKKRT